MLVKILSHNHDNKKGTKRTLKLIMDYNCVFYN